MTDVLPYHIYREGAVVYILGGNSGLMESLANFERILEEGIHFVVLSDMTMSARPSPEERDILRAWFSAHQGLLNDRCVAWAILVKSPLQQNTVELLAMTQKKHYPLRTFRSRQRALEYLQRECSRRVH